MFNRNSIASIVSTHINTISGAITKTYSKSFFVRYHLKSSMAEGLLSPEPKYYCKRDGSPWKEGHSVQVIQMVLCGDMEVMAEIMFQDDYERILGELGHEGI